MFAFRIPNSATISFIDYGHPCFGLCGRSRLDNSFYLSAPMR